MIDYGWDRLHEAVARRALQRASAEFWEAAALYSVWRFLRWANDDLNPIPREENQ